MGSVEHLHMNLVVALQIINARLWFDIYLVFALLDYAGDTLVEWKAGLSLNLYKRIYTFCIKIIKCIVLK